ncbi:hypothetical protein BDV98DRAFT_586831 [Pterulicium gracile]|uniref:Acyl-CoA dehydrogenase NM domain-like protein n=1 Tax=Pterulicium gracile TaxID=1884261 RepID=A0A5C3Q3Q8_9AGAR|nr:hypothetical protein BDV98DRAFT_586831 [Pterula gracilis]
MRSTEVLVKWPLWQIRSETWTFEERVKLSYQRLRTLVQHFGIASDDIKYFSPKYWDMAVYTLLMIHFNLCTGTILKFAPGRPDLQEIVERLLRLKLSGHFCLAELGHGLDVINMETTATLLQDGSFELHTPVAMAANGKDRGARPFLVQLSDGTQMCPGVVCKVQTPLDEHLRLLFRLTLQLKRPENARDLFFFNISRVATGALCIASTVVNAVKISSYIAGGTQYIPVLTGIAQGLVADALKDDVYRIFIEADLKDLTYRNFLAAVLKLINTKFAVTVPVILGDRCGVQGLFEVNRFVPMNADSRAAQIAEGDVVGTSIRESIHSLSVISG